MKKLKNMLWSSFTEGLKLIVPLEILIVFFFFLLDTLDNFLSPILEIFIPREYFITGMGLVMNLALITVFGFILKGVRLRTLVDKLISSLPVIKHFWHAEGTRETFDLMGIPVAVRVFDVLMLGLLMGKSAIYDKTGFVEEDKLFSIYVPSAPMPISGMPIINIPAKHIRRIELVNSPGNQNAARLYVLKNTTTIGVSAEDLILHRVELDADEILRLSQGDIANAVSNLEKAIRILKS